MAKLYTPTTGPNAQLYQTSSGVLVPRVSKILGVPGKPWLKKKPGSEERMREAQIRGTKVHAIAASLARGENLAIWHPKMAPEMKPHASAVADFLNTHVSECIEVELLLTSERLGFGGRFDLYARLHNGLYAVIDWKTTSSLTREHGLQLAAYALLCREYGMPVNKRIAVRIKMEAPGKFGVRTYFDHPGDVEAFLALKTYWHWAHRRTLKAA